MTLAIALKRFDTRQFASLQTDPVRLSSHRRLFPFAITRNKTAPLKRLIGVQSDIHQIPNTAIVTGITNHGAIKSCC